MIAIGGLRSAVALTQVVLTFAAAQLGAVAVASRYQQDQERAARASMSTAAGAFAALAKQVLDDGTPHAMVDPLLARRAALELAAGRHNGFFIDRARIDAMNGRAAALQALAREVAATETQAEVQLNQQVMASIKALRDLVPLAQSAGIDPADYAAFADTAAAANHQLTIPRLAQQSILDVRARADALTQATSDKIAADASARQAELDRQAARDAAEALVRQAALDLQAARDGAQATLQGAQATLARAKTITVLKVADNERTINDLARSLSDKLAAQAPIADFWALSTALRNQTGSLNQLMEIRQATYDLLNLARRELDAAQKAKNDVTSERSQLESLAPQLDQAGDVAAITNIKAQVQAIKNAVDSKYLAALYGVGKVIVVSVTQERLVALQDGVIVLDTLITSGRPSLPTVLGTFHIFYKSSPYHMCTPAQWRGTQYDYGCVNEQWAMEFESSGYFIHDAYWRTHYGPGSDTESGGTHGCVNVPAQQMQWLYGWADVGTPVITKTGDLPG